ncbi:MAG: hypothetical protein LHW59_05390 [Candidatus Cloacimonetes bacterium]|nr:hypothetical protein [Candidatus Cloacimonadota bacterium]
MITEVYRNFNISIETLFNSGVISEKGLYIGDGQNIVHKERGLFMQKLKILEMAKNIIDSILDKEHK